MRSVRWAATAAAVLLGVNSSIAGAQATCTGNPCTVQVTASATVNDVLRLTLSSATANLGTPAEADYDAGFLDAAGPTASVKSNPISLARKPTSSRPAFSTSAPTLALPSRCISVP